MSSPDPYAELTDVQVLQRAAAALKKEAELPPGSIQRAIQGAVFDSHMNELGLRAVRHALSRWREAAE